MGGNEPGPLRRAPVPGCTMKVLGEIVLWILLLGAILGAVAFGSYLETEDVKRRAAAYEARQR